MTGVALIGYAAAILGTVGWLPQVARTLRTRSVNDLSLPTSLMLLGTMALWFTYGLLMGDWPIILANGFSGACVITLIAAKLRWGNA